jgi:hypothetical protein
VTTNPALALLCVQAMNEQEEEFSSNWSISCERGLGAKTNTGPTSTFEPDRSHFFDREQQQAGSSRQQQASSQEHNTRHSHTRIQYLTSVTNRSNTKMGVSNSKVLNKLEELGDDLKELNTSTTKMGDELKALNTKLDRIDNRTTLMVEAQCRDKSGLDRKEIKGVCGA